MIKERDSTLIDSVASDYPQNPSGNRESNIRLKPSLVTKDIPLAPQLPTPPPQQSSPISPHEIVAGDLYSNLNDNGEGPSRKAMGKEPEEPKDFIHQARGRYKETLQAEKAASNDTDKLRLFLEFIEKECRLRGQIYESADPADLKRLARISSLISGPKSLEPISPGLGAFDDDGDVDMNTPLQDMFHKSARPASQWWSGVQNLTSASLPPQSAMSAYESRVAEEESSRGRTSSRWWESSGDGGSCSISENLAIRSDDNDSACGTSYPRRSRRLTKTPRQSLREIAELANTPRNSARVPNPNDPSGFMNSAAFPPDRKSHSDSRSRSRAPSTSRVRTRRRHNAKTSLDIAPLLTLLPSWPREYPAINNCHPRLDVFRDLVRTLNDLSPLTTLQTRFAESTGKSKEIFLEESERRRISQAERIQGLYSRGDLNYDEMERLNLDFEREEGKIHCESEEEDFKSFDAEVVTPAHRDLHERITAAGAAYADLVNLIKVRKPMVSEEEGPELLEYLTALKWIFDIRETLHQHVFEMLSQRNERYKSLIIAPLRHARDQGRLHSTTAFFAQDSATRLSEFNKSKVVRHEKFMEIIEEQVMLGVEEARSKFWETAPLVMECLEKIPVSLGEVVPIVPPEESVKHPEWIEQPMRYLERKIAVTEGAMRGLGVEEGEGLLCLLHGVKSALARAKSAVMDDGGREERRLTEDLKEKVGMIEEEWREGLGMILERVRRNVGIEMERIEPGRAEP